MALGKITIKWKNRFKKAKTFQKPQKSKVSSYRFHSVMFTHLKNEYVSL